MEAAPQMNDLTILTCDEWVRGMVRKGGAIQPVELDFRNEHKLVRTIFDRDLTEVAKGPYWAEVAFVTPGTPALTVRQRLVYHGAPRGLLIATIPTSSLADASQRDGGADFVLWAGTVIASSRPLGTTAVTGSDGKPIADADPIIRLRGTGRPGPVEIPGEKSEIVNNAGKDYALFTREITGFGPRPVIVGAYWPLADISS
jgi:hypothetical protein